MSISVFRVFVHICETFLAYKRRVFPAILLRRTLKKTIFLYTKPSKSSLSGRSAPGGNKQRSPGQGEGEVIRLRQWTEDRFHRRCSGEFYRLISLTSYPYSLDRRRVSPLPPPSPPFHALFLFLVFSSLLFIFLQKPIQINTHKWLVQCYLFLYRSNTVMLHSANVDG